MNWESAVELKASLVRGNGSATLLQAPLAVVRAASAIRAPLAAAAPGTLPVAIGISGRRNSYRLAVRVQETVPGLELVLDHIRQQSKGEMEVRHIGRILAQAPWHQRRNRPMRIGGSIGRVDITAGTLGCFVTPRSGDGSEDWILSNNHVLADENRGKVGDPILQPGDADGGRRSRDKVGTLAKSIRLKRRSNLLDAAVAHIDEGIEYNYNWLEKLGAITSVRTDPLDAGEIVHKVGRTTGVTKGRVSSIELDSVVVGDYYMGDLEFDRQIEIETFVSNKPFSLGGDSGSLIVDSRRRAVALLFAGNDLDSTLATPIGTVLDAFKVDLVY